MPTRTEIERLTREILRESDSDLTVHSVEAIDNDQNEELWDISVKCPHCPNRFSILTQAPKGLSPELQIRQKLKEHAATH